MWHSKAMWRVWQSVLAGSILLRSVLIQSLSFVLYSACFLSLNAADSSASPLSVFSPQQTSARQVTANGKNLSREAVQVLARQLDAYVDDDLLAQGIKPNQAIDDATFVRRIYVDIAGRIPTAVEATTFLNATQTDKRFALIDRLLDSPAYVSHNFNYWADVLRVKSKLSGQASGRPYIDYMKQAIAENKPYDQLVTDLLTASGSAWEKDNGATGYYIRDTGMAADNMSNTVQIFLGTRIGCAQCHDHPFDKWKRKDFLSMQAFTNGVNARAGGLPQAKEARKILGKDAKKDPALRKAARMLNNGLAMGVQDKGHGAMKVPKDYQYNDAKPGDVLKAETLFGDHMSVGKGDQPRERFATWLCGHDNPRFTAVISNRIWKKVMGRGLVEPIDDWKDDTKPSNPLLMSFLNQTMQSLGYDLKQYQRVLFYSNAYQRAAFTGDWNPDQVYHFPGPMLRRLSAEELWDSLLTLIMPDVDLRAGPNAEDPSYAHFQALKGMSGEELAQVTRVIAGNDSKRREIIDTKIKPLREEVQQLRKDGADKKKIKLAQNALRQAGKELKGYQTGLDAALVQVSGPNNADVNGADLDDQSSVENMGTMESGMDSMSSMAARTVDKQSPSQVGKAKKSSSGKNKKDEDPRWRGFDKRLVRASELPMPMNAGHFLREFGQSDREQIENANTDASITQILDLLNGFTQQQVLNNRSMLMRDIKALTSPEQKIEHIFISILARKPSSSEQQACLAELQQHADTFYADLVWSLVNTNEFMFVQ